MSNRKATAFYKNVMNNLLLQIILLNPVCTVLYTVASWSFFRERVYFEEVTLVSFFGEIYQNYQESVSTGLPFIRGYSVEQDNNLFRRAVIRLWMTTQSLDFYEQKILQIKCRYCTMGFPLWFFKTFLHISSTTTIFYKYIPSIIFIFK